MDRPLTIAMFVDGFLPVSETFIVRQITGLLARGHAVDIFASVPVHPEDMNQEAVRAGLGARVRYYRGPRGYRARVTGGLRLAVSVGRQRPLAVAGALNVLRYRRAALSLDLLYAAAAVQAAGRRGRYDIVHSQFGPLGILAQRLRQLGVLQGRLVTAFRGYDATAYLDAHPRSYRRLFEQGELFCPVSESLKARIVAAGCPEEKVAVLASGIDVHRLSFVPRRREPGDPVKLLTVARLVEKKGVAYALQAVARLVDAGKDISYTIAGDGPLRPRIELLVRDLGLASRVRLLGWVDGAQVSRLLQEAHILVAPSITAEDGDQEGIPNTLKEAMATGMPVVSTWHGGIGELVEHGSSGFLVPERDVEALAGRLAYLADHPETWPGLGQAGRERVQQQFDSDRLNDRLIELYRRLLGHSAANVRTARVTAEVQ